MEHSHLAPNDGMTLHAGARMEPRQQLDTDLVQSYCRAFLDAAAFAASCSANTMNVSEQSDTIPQKGRTHGAPLSGPRSTNTSVRGPPVKYIELDATCPPAHTGLVSREGSPSPRKPVQLDVARKHCPPATKVPDANRVTPSKQAIIKICKSFRLHGTCRFGSRCLYHHMAVPSPSTVSWDTDLKPTKGDRQDVSPLSVTVSAPTSREGTASAERGDSSLTTLSLSPTLPHSAHAHSERSGDSDSEPRLGAARDRWDVLRVRVAKKVNTSKSRSSPRSSEGKSRSASATGQIYTRTHSPSRGRADKVTPDDSATLVRHQVRSSKRASKPPPSADRVVGLPNGSCGVSAHGQQSAHNDASTQQGRDQAKTGAPTQCALSVDAPAFVPSFPHLACMFPFDLADGTSPGDAECPFFSPMLSGAQIMCLPFFMPSSHLAPWSQPPTPCWMQLPEGFAPFTMPMMPSCFPPPTHSTDGANCAEHFPMSALPIPPPFMPMMDTPPFTP